jgi:3D-(3,5/4)-trihydroxycyclohexane-1,2-dione acylhydrolase (decyclizing)
MRLTVAQALVRFPADALPVDLAANAESLGARVIRTVAELRRAPADARGADGAVVVPIEAGPYAGVPEYESWSDVPVAEVSDDDRSAPSARRARAHGAQRAHLQTP